MAHPLLYMRGTGHKIDINIMGGSHVNFSRTRLDYGVRPTVFYASLPWEETIETIDFVLGKLCQLLHLNCQAMADALACGPLGYYV